jgi:conjugative transfer signal peptidase TraF
MTEVAIGARRIGQRTRNTMAVVLVGLVLIIAILFAGTAAGFRVNMTPSEPLGLWRIRPLHRPVAIGDLVFICPPAIAAFAEARLRGYLHRGFCASGYAPLIKTVIATEGQRVDIGANVSVDGRTIANSRIVRIDGAGRALHGHAGGTVPSGNVFLHSPFSASWDSRYFGPIPASGILGLAQEVLTYAP